MRKLVKGMMDAMTGASDQAQPLTARIRAYYEKHGYEWQSENIIGILDVSKKNDNTFSDCLAIVTDSEVYAMPATLVPGTKWNGETRKKFNISQEGVYVLGFYKNLWKFGQHHGRAWVQCGKASWYVDANLNKRLDTGEKIIHDDVCAMNIHRKTQDNATTVDFASAGCFVPRRHADIENAIEMCGWQAGKNPPAKKFHGFITDTESFTLAGEIFKMIRKG